MGKRELADPKAVREERMRERRTFKGTVTITKKALAAMQPRGQAFVDFAESSPLAVADLALTGNADAPKEKLFARLFGAPRTKKNHGKVIWRKVKGVQTRFHVPSDAYAEWCAAVVAQLSAAPEMPNRAYNCKAVFYRKAATGDAVGYYQGLADALEAAGVVSDDKLITQWDGSRLRVDRANPRVELTLTPVEE